MALSRKFIDSEGVHWQVYELADDAAVDRLGHRSWLYFFSRSVTRSLASYPDDWAMMDWPGLERLCDTARPPVQREVPPRHAAAVQGAEV